MIAAHIVTHLLTGGSAQRRRAGTKQQDDAVASGGGETTDALDSNEMADVDCEVILDNSALCHSLPLDTNMYEDDSETTSCSESRLDSSFSKSRIYEKLVRKQMSSGDPEITSILKDSENQFRHDRRTPVSSDHVMSSADQYSDSQRSYDRRTPTHTEQRSANTLDDSLGSYGRRTPTHHDHRSTDHHRDREFQPIANRSVSVDNLTSQSEKSHSYDFLSGRRSVDRNHRDVGEQKFLSGLPPMSPARRGSGPSDKRSSTPDSHHHQNSDTPAGSSPGQPVLKSALLTNRTAPVSSSSRPSSRSSLPVTASSGKDDATKIQDLEDTVITLKKLLSDRDKETNLIRKENQDLHAINCQLKTQLEDYKKDGRKTPVITSDTDTTKTEDTQPPRAPKSDVTPATKSEYERKINQLINERENLETEMWKLRQQLGERADGTIEGESTVLDNYKPNNPYALQRKIDELESQVQDLQEANETAVSNDSKSERKTQKLRQENEKLKEELGNSRKDLEAENERLREEVDRLKTAQSDGVMNGSLDEFGLQREVQALRQDLRFLREKNHQLNEDNIKLIEHLQDLRRREKEQILTPPHHIPRGILDKDGDRSEELQLSDSKPAPEYRKFSPVPASRVEKDKYPSNKYSSGNLRPSTRKTDSDTSYKLEQLNGINHRDQGESPTPSESSDCTATLTDAPPNGYVDGEGYPDPGVGSEITHPPLSNVSQDLHQIFIHDSDMNVNRQQHKPRSILRKKEPPMSYEYRDTLITQPSTDRCQEKSSLGDLCKTHKRSSSAGSSSSLESILDELEQEFGVSIGRANQKPRTRTRSAGAVEQRSHSSRSGSPVPMDSIGFRSISPKPVPTQHNRGLLGIGSPENESFSTLGKRPFAPRNPADINVHDIVKFARQGGRICRGLVKFIGHLPGRNDTYIGVELDKDDGKHDGTFEGVRYFKCKPNKGVFVAFNKVVMAWGP